MLFYSTFKYTLIIWINTFLFVFSQNDSIIFSSKNQESILLEEIILESFNAKSNPKINYFLLKHRVLKVYPYVDSIAQIVNEANKSLLSIDKKRASRRYTKKIQKDILKKFSKNIKNLTRKEGVILSKLVYREFNITVYDLISKYRGGFQAFIWQRLSKLYDGDLKSSFDPTTNKEDFVIESILEKYVNE